MEIVCACERYNHPRHAPEFLVAFLQSVILQRPLFWGSHGMRQRRALIGQSAKAPIS